MSFDDDNELIDCEMFGMKFKATHAEQRRLWVKLSTSTESKAWGQNRNLMHMLVAHGTLTTDVKELALAMELSDQVMTKLAHRLIEEMISARAS